MVLLLWIRQALQELHNQGGCTDVMLRNLNSIVDSMMAGLHGVTKIQGTPLPVPYNDLVSVWQNTYNILCT